MRRHSNRTAATQRDTAHYATGALAVRAEQVWVRLGRHARREREAGPPRLIHSAAAIDFGRETPSRRSGSGGRRASRYAHFALSSDLSSVAQVAAGAAKRLSAENSSRSHWGSPVGRAACEVVGVEASRATASVRVEHGAAAVRAGSRGQHARHLLVRSRGPSGRRTPHRSLSSKRGAAGLERVTKVPVHGRQSAAGA